MQDRFRDSLWFDILSVFGRRLGFILVPLPTFGPYPEVGGAPGAPAGPSPAGPLPTGTARVAFVRGPLPPYAQGPLPQGVYTGPAPMAPVFGAMRGTVVHGPNPSDDPPCCDSACGNCYPSDKVPEPDMTTLDGQPVVSLSCASRERTPATSDRPERDLRRFEAPGVRAESILRVESWDSPNELHMVYLSILARVPMPPMQKLTAALLGGFVGDDKPQALPEHLFVRASTLVPRDFSRVHVSVDEAAGMIDVAIDGAVDVTNEVFPQGKPLS